MTTASTEPRAALDAADGAAAARLGLGWVLVLAGGHFLAFVDRAVPGVYAPVLKTSFGLSDAQLGALQGPAFVALYVFATLLAGHSRNRVPPARLLACCMLFWTLGAVVFSLAAGFGQLLAGRLLLGLGQAAYAPTALALLVQGAPAGGLGRSVSIFTSGSAMGRSGAMLLGGLVLALVAGTAGLGMEPWRIASLLLAAPNLLLAALIWRLPGGDRTPPADAGLAVAFRRVVARPASLGLHFLAAAGVVLMVQAAGAWAPSVLNRLYGLAPATSAMLAGAVVLVGAPAGHLGAGWLLDRLSRAGRGPAAVIAAGATLAAAAALALASAAGPVQAALAFLAVTVAGGAAAAATLAGLQPLSPPRLRRATSSLFFAFVTVAGLGLGPWLTGLLSDHVFAGRVGSALAALMLCSAAVVVAAALAGAAPSRRLAAQVEEDA